MQPTTATHTVEFDVDYPDRPLDRFSTLLRPLFAIPILVVLGTAHRRLAMPVPCQRLGNGRWV